MTTKPWQHLTLGDLYRGGIAKLRQARRLLRTYSPVKLDLTATRNLWGAVSPLLMAPLLYVLEGWREHRGLPQAELTVPESLLLCPATALVNRVHKPWYRRTEKVNQVLAQAWVLGIHTYNQLIAEVRLRTGMGCSKRAIARFIKHRRAPTLP